MNVLHRHHNVHFALSPVKFWKRLEYGMMWVKLEDGRTGTQKGLAWVPDELTAYKLVSAWNEGPTANLIWKYWVRSIETESEESE